MSSGSSIRAISASTISPRWWGGMLVAMPTAIPEEPLMSRFGSFAGQDRRLAMLAVVVVGEVDRRAVDVGQHLGRDRRQARFGVAHRRRRIAVDRAEVALAVDQRVAHREVLGEADEGVVDRRIAVRVELAHHLADDRRALPEGARGREPHLAHRVEDPAMDRLEPVTDVGQGARHDHAHRVVEVGRPHLVLDADRADVAQVVGHGRVLRWQEAEQRVRSARERVMAAVPQRPGGPGLRRGRRRPRRPRSRLSAPSGSF